MHSSHVYVLDKVPTMLQPALSTPFPPWCAARRKWYLIPGLCFYKLPEWNRISPQPYLYDMNGYRMFITKLSSGKMIKHRHKQLPLCIVPSTYCDCTSDFSLRILSFKLIFFFNATNLVWPSTVGSSNSVAYLDIPTASSFLLKLYCFDIILFMFLTNHLEW